MVVFVDLDDAFADGSAHLEKPFPLMDPIASDPAELPTSPSSPNKTTDEIVNPNRNGFSAALSCYPIVKEIARAIDLNTLYALSSTCRQFHVNLAPFRHQIVRETLRCENEYIETLSRDARQRLCPPRQRQISHTTPKPSQRRANPYDPREALKNRIRRLCRPCGKAPLSSHLSYTTSDPHAPDRWDENSVAAVAFARSPCNCEEAVWLCTQCGMALRSNDTTYRRVWTWRTRYSTYLGGGLGTGIGEGCQGVKCGRGESCLAAQEIELEVDCEADEGSGSGSDTSRTASPAPPSFGHEGAGVPTDSHDDEEPGYFRQEVIGLGGVVKHKSKKRVNVGACVVEYEDERETGNYLEREEKGLYRGWCGWCSRVIPAKSEQT
ncbi:hypothetical protein N7519_004493 [Penicillium mononematosum]|uniref:uncharacterized protein n=1 Tax=Penicillium mononematosum TaxID=268346 RepID=UPI002548FC46|nr:uncharacterized protein N7519_004493 [Penicillium mononematosum]KAJ6189585.1 hypothetical protein N7519_004493 [Penicillium mononematosum]